MLENLPCPPQERCLTIDGLPVESLPFLQALFEIWRYQVKCSGSSLVLVKKVHQGSQPLQPCLDLQLRPPLDLPELWASVASRFHVTPRRHIRLRQEVPAELTVDGGSHSCRLTSFSQPGGRIFFPHELIRGEQGQIRFRLGEHTFDTPCEVIYVLPKREWEEQRGAEVGIVFRWQNAQDSRRVLAYIVHQFLAKVQKVLSQEKYETGLKLFELPKGNSEG